MGKRHLDDGSSSQRKSKRAKLDGEDGRRRMKGQEDEVDFPRGGGTILTPLEVKAVRAEAVKEADKELFENTRPGVRTAKKRKHKPEVMPDVGSLGRSERIRIEHLNYKRLNIGTKILGQVYSVQPLGLVVSLPNQLLAHVPITNVSSQFTALLGAMEDEREDKSSESDDEESSTKLSAPDLTELFRPGEYVRAIVTEVHEPGSESMLAVGKTRDPIWNASRRVELSLVPDKVNNGIQKSDLRKGYTLTSAIKSIEDYGYTLDLGVPDVSGFLSFKDAKDGPFLQFTKLPLGKILDVTVTAMLSNDRMCNVTVDPAIFTSSTLTEVSNASSLLPGMLVQSLVTVAHSTGLNLQVLGYFEGTIDQFHLGAEPISYKVGKKVKARVLYRYSASPPRFSLSLKDHVVRLNTKCVLDGKPSTPSDIEEAYPIGTILNNVTVLRTEQERGLIVGIQSGLEGFVHISHTSDDHVPSLPSKSGPWKIGTKHRARVTGYFVLDGLLELSMRQSVLEQKFMQVEEVKVGEIMTGTVKKLSESGLFLSLSGNIDGVIWPNHYADILLKYPARRFKVGKSIKCRVLVVDPERRRIALTAKKTLLESTLPILSKLEDVKVGVVTHAVVFKVLGKNVMVEFYNNLKATVPFHEASETPKEKLSDSFAIGKVVQVRIISVTTEPLRVVASIRQAGSHYKSTVTDITGVEIGHVVQGTLTDIHKDNAVLTLEPSKTRALISLKNLANHRSTSVAQLRASLKEGTKLEGLIVVLRNSEKGFVIVATSQKAKTSLPAKSSISIDTVTMGQMVGGRVTRHVRSNAIVKLNSHIGGVLHPINISDDYDTASALPAVDSVIKAAVVGIEKAKRRLVLSTRQSRMYPDKHTPVVDREIQTVADLNVGETIRGFIKTISEHGLFVTVGPDIDARVQIKELFDEYIKDWKARFQTSQLVKGRILSVDVGNNKVEMTFRSETLTKISLPSLTLSDFHEGQKLNAHVKKIEEYGLFLEIEGSKVSGLCHKSELSDNKNADVSLALRSFREGDQVKAVVLSIDVPKHRISFGLKPSYFEGDNRQDDDAQFDSKGSNGSHVSEDDHDQDDNASVEGKESSSSAQSDPESDEESVHIDLNAPSQPEFEHAASAVLPSLIDANPLKIPGGFQWSVNNQQEPAPIESESSDNDDGETRPNKKKRRRKVIEQDLTADLHNKTPESNADFERLLLGSPDSSFLWIQYMSFQLRLSEVDKAREIGRRAIQAINFREEREKLNIWIALLNLENVYGTDETLESTFKDAARHNDSKAVHLRLASILDQAEKYQKAEEQYRRTSKKFGQSSKVWTLFGEYYFRRGETEEARKLLPRSLQSLDKRKHLKTISKFAQMEYKLGDPERGRTIFEGIVDSHPKRWDLWSIYMDMEAGQENIDTLRRLFDRLFTLKMTSYKAKFFFKKWLALEKKMGDEEGTTNVKQKAIEWTQKINNS